MLRKCYIFLLLLFCSRTHSISSSFKTECLLLKMYPSLPIYLLTHLPAHPPVSFPRCGWICKEPGWWRRGHIPSRDLNQPRAGTICVSGQRPILKWVGSRGCGGLASWTVWAVHPHTLPLLPTWSHTSFFYPLATLWRYQCIGGPLLSSRENG